MEAIKLKKNQEINSVNLRPGDNGGCMLSYTIYTPSLTNRDSTWDERNEIFSDDQIEEALDRIKDIYRANLEARKKSVPAENIVSDKG